MQTVIISLHPIITQMHIILRIIMWKPYVVESNHISSILLNVSFYSLLRTLSNKIWLTLGEFMKLLLLRSNIHLFHTWRFQIIYYPINISNYIPQHRSWRKFVITYLVKQYIGLIAHLFQLPIFFNFYCKIKTNICWTKLNSCRHFYFLEWRKIKIK